MSEPNRARWLVVQSSALLDTVPTENYVRYGGCAVPRYGVGQPAPAAVPPLSRLVVTLSLRGQMLPDLTLTILDNTVRQVVWNGYDRLRRLQTAWVWDFYRIQSHLVLRVLLPTHDDALDPAWRETLDPIRALQPGDPLVIEACAGCGNIHQTHTLAAAPFERTS